MNTFSTKLNAQPVHYKNVSQYRKTLKKLQRYPPIVTGKEIYDLKSLLTKVQNGKAFILQGGHCAETFDDFSTNVIMSTFQTLIESSYALQYNKSIPVVTIGRMAGQYGKPRSNLMEGEYFSYRGDNINGYELEDREPDPERLVLGYLHSASTMNFIRTLQSSNYYDIDFIENTGQVNKKYEKIVENIKRALIFSSSELSTEFFISHEGMHLEYEKQFVRTDSKTHKQILTSTHFPWIGERTRQLHGAHVEFFKDVDNPIGIKVSHKADIEEISKIIETLNPCNESGKIVIIIRMGANNIERHLERILELNSKYNLIWMSDPMHGNTKSVNGTKTRYFSEILKEYKSFDRICKEKGIYPGGLHIEMTGEIVTECLDSNYPELVSNYKTLCDPRLNRQQSIELILNI